MSTYLTHNGETHNITDWARKVSINRITLRTRLARGWTIERALTTPTEVHVQYNKRQLLRLLAPVLAMYRQQHRAAEHSLEKALHNYVQSFANAGATVSGLDMSTIGQPPADAFTAPGVVGNFAESLPDRSLSSTQEMPKLGKF